MSGFTPDQAPRIIQPDRLGERLAVGLERDLLRGEVRTLDLELKTMTPAQRARRRMNGQAMERVAVEMQLERIERRFGVRR